MINTDVFLTYLDFVVERHKIWERRQAGEPGPWTDDPILATRKFTNDFRVLDHGSQFLLTELLNTAETPADALARAFLYRMTNRTQVWEMTKRIWGDYPHVDNMNSDLADFWCQWRDWGEQVFSGAYIIMPEPGVKGVDKVRSVVTLAQRYFSDSSPLSITVPFYEAGSMAERFKILRSCPGIGPFIAMQVLTDVGYSPFGTDQDENEFVIAGPGCINGAKEIDPGRKAADMIRFCRDAVLELEDYPRLMIPGPSGIALRTLSLMDIQNTLCEFSKYARYMRKSPSVKAYRPAHPGPATAPVLPRHWAL